MLIKTLVYTLLRLTFLAPEPRQNFLIGMRTLSLITLAGGLGRGRHIDVKPVFLKTLLLQEETKRMEKRMEESIKKSCRLSKRRRKALPKPFDRPMEINN